MTLLKERFSYPSLKRTTAKNGSREYVGTSGKPVPSVTTILSKTGDKSTLIEWRKRVGDKEADRISNESARLGTTVHDALEKYTLGEDWQIKGSNLVRKLAQQMAEKVIVNGLSQVDEMWGVEVPIMNEGLYAGTMDGVGLYKGVPSIIDFKTARAMKKREWITDYFLQGSAYALAHNQTFGTEISQIVIMMVDREANYESFICNGDDYTKHCDLWAQRVLDYYNSER